MERTIRAQAARLRGAVEAAAERSRVSWSFRVARGRVSTELLAAAEEADIVIVGKASGSAGKSVRIGSTARAVVAGAQRTVVLLQRGVAFGRPVLVIYDGSSSSGRGLAIGADIALEGAEGLMVVIPAEGAAALAESAAEYLSGRHLEARYLTVPSISLPNLLAVLHDNGCRTLVLSAESPLFAGKSAGLVLEKLDCPVVLAR